MAPNRLPPELLVFVQRWSLTRSPAGTVDPENRTCTILESVVMLTWWTSVAMSEMSGSSARSRRARVTTWREPTPAAQELGVVAKLLGQPVAEPHR